MLVTLLLAHLRPQLLMTTEISLEKMERKLEYLLWTSSIIICCCLDWLALFGPVEYSSRF